MNSAAEFLNLLMVSAGRPLVRASRGRDFERYRDSAEARPIFATARGSHNSTAVSESARS